jgi:hypothetical protein
MSKSTPLQVVKERYGSKAVLVDRVVELIEPMDGESTDDHKRRLRNVSNAKLLHLLEAGEKAKAHGGREALVKRILELKGQAKDHEYADKLKTYSSGRLLDLVRSLERKAKRAKA